MGFGDSLWGQFDIVKQNCNTGEKRLKAVKQLFKKTHKEETSYADTISKASAAFIVSGGKSLSSSVETLRAKLLEEQASRSQFASQLEEELQKLNTYTKTYLKTSHQLSQKTSRDQSNYDSKLATLNKTKHHYYGCCKNEEQLQESLGNPNLDPKKQDSLNQQLEKAKESKSQAQDQYSVMVNDHDRVYEDYIVACRDTLNQYEELEKTLCETLEAALKTYASKRSDVASSLTSYSSSMMESVNTIKVDSDLSEFVHDNSKLLVPGPAPQYEEYSSGTPSKAPKAHRKTTLFGKPKLGGSSKKRKSSRKGEDDDCLSPRATSSPLRESSGPATDEGERDSAPPPPPPAPTRAETTLGRADSSEPAPSPPATPSRADSAPAPAPPSRADSGPAPPPPSRADSGPAPPPPSRGDSGPAPPPPSRGDSGPAPPPPSRSDSSGPPPIPSRTDSSDLSPPATPSRADSAPAPAPPSRADSGPAPPPPSRGDSGPPPAPPRGGGDAAQVQSANWKIAVALYPNDGEESELKLEEGTALFVINEDPTGWWLGATANAVGFFPGSYIQYLDDDEQIDCVRAKALQDFVGDVEGDLSLDSGEVVTIMDYKDSWYTGAKKNGEVGIFPCQYVQLLTDD